MDKEFWSKLEITSEEQQRAKTIAVAGGRRTGKSMLALTLYKAAMKEAGYSINHGLPLISFDEPYIEKMILPGKRTRQNDSAFMSAFDTLIDKCKVKK